MFLNCLEDDFEEANGHLNFPASLPISIRYIVVPRTDCHSDPGRLLFGSGSLCRGPCVVAFTSRPNDSVRTSTSVADLIRHRPPRSVCSPRNTSQLTTPTSTCCRPNTVVSCRVAVTLRVAAKWQHDSHHGAAYM